ncbi:hypothetical protein V6N13_069545 [Hibiscus sabdariffa]
MAGTVIESAFATSPLANATVARYPIQHKPPVNNIFDIFHSVDKIHRRQHTFGAVPRNKTQLRVAIPQRQRCITLISRTESTFSCENSSIPRVVKLQSKSKTIFSGS